MKTKQNTLFIAACIFIYMSNAVAQTTVHEIKALSKVDKGRVILRWAPNDFVTWQLGNKYGYTVARYSVNKGGVIGADSLTLPVIKPFTSPQFDDLAKSLPEAEMIQELIYGAEQNQPLAENPMALLTRKSENNNRFGMALLICDFFPPLAKSAGLLVSDSSVTKDARYIYKVSLAINPSKINVEPAVVVVDAKEPKPLQPFKDVTATFADLKVTLQWPMLTHKGIYSGYIIERSEDGKMFKKITDLPYIPMTTTELNEAHFVDSLAVNDKTYFYQVKGITPFGETGPPSNIVSGTGKEDLMGLVVLRDVKRDNKNNVSLTWEYPAAFENKIKGFVVVRAARSEGPYTTTVTKVLDGKTRTATDAGVTSSAYYRVKAVDAKGVEITHSQPFFLHVEDNVPPVDPQELTGTADKNGFVTLKWKQNPDKDLMGYRLFSSNDPNHEFVEISKKILGSNAYIDTINSKLMNEKIYYKVVAVDNNFNASGYSKMCVVNRPDLTAPVAPVFNKVEKDKNNISIQWTNSPSEDVASYDLYRRKTSDTTRTLLKTWTAKVPTSYTDEAPAQGFTYQYILMVSDKAGNRAKAESKEIKFESGIRKEVTELKALIDRDNKLIILRWTYDAKIKKCLIYKKKAGEQFSLYQTLDGSLSEFIDKQVIVNTTYSYKIQLVTESNARTELSKELKVPF